MDGAFFERRSRVPTPDAGQAGPCLAGRCICQFCQSGGKRRWRDSNPQTFLRSPVFGTGCLPVSTHLHIVGRAGFEPASPKATVLQTACLIQFAYLPRLYERRERDSNPQSAFADHRFSIPARYHLRHHSIVSGTGFEPASPKGHMILSHARFPVSHPDKAYRRRDSNPQNTAFEAGTYSIPSLLQNI